MACDDIKIGGTLGAMSITGGQSIANEGIAVDAYGGLYGPPRQRGQISDVSGQAGGTSTSTEERLPAARLFNLPIILGDVNPATGLADGGFTPAEWTAINQDTVDEIIHSRTGFLIEHIRCDGTHRFLKAFQNGQPLVNVRGILERLMLLQCVAPYPYWRSTLTSSDTIAGADTLTVAGAAPVYDATIVFSGDGTFTNSDTGQSITVAGSSGPVTVHCGDGRTVTQAGVPARNLATPNDDEWMRFDPGTVNVTSTVSCDVSWRSAWSSG